MKTRRDFLKASAMGLTALLSDRVGAAADAKAGAEAKKPVRKPLVVSTWSHGLAANEVAWEVIGHGGKALDAVEAGVMVSEADPKVSTVGFGGAPDRDGCVTLDACIMDEHGNCGSVAFLQNIKHPVAVARLVMEKTPHVMLAGEGALQFALANGFTKENLLTPEAETAWRRWLAKNAKKPVIDRRNHDTIGMLAIDDRGRLSGACTTSGAAYKMHGRVGDSPIIGAALYVDNDVGAACTTGLGEAVMKNLTSFLAVEMMRQGLPPQSACEAVIQRIMDKHELTAELQVGCLAIDKSGRIGAFSISEGFQYAVHDASGNKLVDAGSWS